MRSTRAILFSAFAAIMVAFAVYSLTTGGTSDQSTLAPAQSGQPAGGTAEVAHRAKKAKFAPHQLLVRFKTDSTAPQRRSALRHVGATTKKKLGTPGLELVALPKSTTVAAARTELGTEDAVAYAEPDYVFDLAYTPNDPKFTDNSLWGLNNIGQTLYSSYTGNVTGTADADMDVPEAWDSLAGGSPNVVVAVLDTGVDMSHQDLSGNIWTNPGETGGGKETNGIDDDGNGLKDDWHGWDFANADNDPSPIHFHGTHVAGTIAATGNNGLGIAGVSYNSKILPIQAFRPYGDDAVAYSSDLIDGMDYAGKMGAKVVNGSFGGPGDGQAFNDTIRNYPKTLFVVAAGNSAANNDDPYSAQFPCSVSAANLMCVAASDQNDKRAAFSNYGATTVDLAAPGVNIMSTLPGNQYGMLQGTSMASPNAAGAAAELFGVDSSADPITVKRALMDTVDPLAAFATTTVSGGRINLARAVASVKAPATGTSRVAVDNSTITYKAGSGQTNNVSISLSASTYTISDSGTTIAVGSGCTSVSAGQATCPSTGVTKFNIRSGDGNDTVALAASVTADATIYGEDGNDVLTGGAGNDTLSGGSGADTIDGAGGTSDTADYSAATAAQTISLDGSPNDGAAGEGDNVSVNTENVDGGSGADTIIGSSVANRLDGEGGDDAIDGQGGDDSIYGRRGSNTLRGGDGVDSIAGGMNNDLVIGGPGADTMIGGDGRDTVSYEDRTNPVSVTFDGTNNDGESGENDTLNADFEVVRGGSGGDSFTGYNQSPVTYIGGLGADTFATTNTADTVSYSDRTTPVNVNLLDSGTDGAPGEGDVISGPQNIAGGSGNDTLIGSDQPNVLDGGLGADTIDGKGPTGYYADSVSYAQRTNNVYLDSDGVADDGETGEGDNIVNVESLEGGSGNDTIIDAVLGGTSKLTGNAGNDTLIGNDGEDYLVGGQGNDALYGGDGRDFADYSDHSKGVNVTLDGVVNDGQPGESDALTDIECITGGAGDDYLEGNAGDNILNGGAGEDTIRPGLGRDSIDGGYTDVGTFNTITYSERTNPVTIDQRTPASPKGGEAGEADSISRIQNYVGGSGNDTIYGKDYSDDHLYGGPGNDYLNGLGWDDDLYGQTGADTLVGGDGNDLVSYSNRTQGVSTSSDGTANDGEPGEGDNIASDVEIVEGSPYNDTMQGGSTTSVNVWGLAGNDTLRGAPGANVADALIGGDGNDTISGDAGDDALYGGLGNDSLDGGSGSDMVNYYDATAKVTIEPNGQPTSGQAGETDTIATNVEKLYGSNYDDTITGSDADNILSGGAGNDTYYGKGGNDNIDGGSDGADDVWGGSGIDSISYDGRWTRPVRVTMGDDTANDGWFNGANSVEFDNIHSDMENVTGSRAEPDTLTGNDSANVINGNFGSDTINGLGGDDTLLGGPNVEADYSGLGNNDKINGGDGNDTVSYADHNIINGQTLEPVNVSLDGVNNNDGANATNVAESDQINTDVENVTGGGQPDVLSGSAGNNILDGGPGGDTLTGLGGTDTVTYASRTNPVTVTADGAAANDGESGELDNVAGDVENITGGSGADNISGNALANTLLGGSGNDVLSGQDGTDTLDGQGGGDTFDGGAGTGDTVTYTSRTNPVSATANGAADDGEAGEGDNISAGVETVRGGSGNDTLTAGGALAILYGGDGNDTISGKTVAGSQSYGENGNDTITLNDGLANSADCGAGTADSVTPDSSGDSTSNCETIVQVANVTVSGGVITYNASNGQANNVTVATNSTNYRITDTGSGVNLTVGTGCTRVSATVADCPQSGKTAIVVNTGDGNDTINQNVATSAASTVNAGDGNDTLTGGTGKHVFIGGNGTDSISYSSRTTAINVSLDDVANDGQSGEADDVRSDIENVTTGSGADTIVGSTATNVIDSGSGNDTVNGGLGNVADTINGNGGTDTLTYAGFTAGVTVNIGTSGAQNTVNAGSDTLSNFENLTGGSGGDVLTGNSSANTIDGGLGADSISALAGADTILIRDGVNDLTTSCGSGLLQTDKVTADKTTIGDPVSSDCESVSRG